MLLITTIEVLSEMSENDLKQLVSYKPADRIIVLSKAGATMPVALFKTLSTLKCSLEIKECDIKDQFGCGYMIGRMVSNAGQGEKVQIMIGKKAVFEDDKNVTWTESLSENKAGTASKAVKSKKTAAERNEADAKPTSDNASKKSAAKPAEKTAVKTNEKPEEKTAVKTNEKSAAKTTAKTAEKNDAGFLAGLISEYPGLKKYRKFLEANEESFREAITSAVDAEITFKFQLQIRFGENGVGIWDVIGNDFDKIKLRCISMSNL